MKSMQSVLGLVISAISALASAGTITLTGAQLASYPSVSFPTTQPRVEGAALMFDSGANDFEKLFTLPVYSGGPIGPAGIDIGLTLNLTMRPCGGGHCLGLWDWDPLFLLGDGARLLGVQLDNDGNLYIEEFTDNGATGNRTRHDYLYDRSAPVPNGAVDIALLFHVGAAGTSVTIGYDGPAQIFSFGPILDPSAGLDLVFMRDNDQGEQHQLNQITASAPDLEPPYQVPEPSTLAILSLGLAFLSLRRSTGTH